MVHNFGGRRSNQQHFINQYQLQMEILEQNAESSCVKGMQKALLSSELYNWEI